VDGNGGKAYNFKQILVPEAYRGGDNQIPYCATNCVAHAAVNEAGLKHYVGFNYESENDACICHYSSEFPNKDLTSNSNVGTGAIQEVDGSISSKSSMGCFKNKVSLLSKK
jgi:hypothetical protein